MDQKNDAIKEEDMVLIDTWWNVNAFRTFYLSHSAKF